MTPVAIRHALDKWGSPDEIILHGGHCVRVADPLSRRDLETIPGTLCLRRGGRTWQVLDTDLIAGLRYYAHEDPPELPDPSAPEVK